MYRMEGRIIQARAPAMMTEARSRATSVRSPRPDKRRRLTDRRRRAAAIPKQFSVRPPTIVCKRTLRYYTSSSPVSFAPPYPLPPNDRARAGLTPSSIQGGVECTLRIFKRTETRTHCSAPITSE